MASFLRLRRTYSMSSMFGGSSRSLFSPRILLACASSFSGNGRNAALFFHNSSSIFISNTDLPPWHIFIVTKADCTFSSNLYFKKHLSDLMVKKSKRCRVLLFNNALIHNSFSFDTAHILGFLHILL